MIPLDRFRDVEQATLQALPARPYRSLVLPAPALASASRDAAPTVVPRVIVERRALATYAALAAGGEP